MEFTASSFELFDRQWALLTAGTEGHYNTMTVSWGGLGTLWGKPVATVYVKPVRYTHSFMEESPYFTLSFYPERYRKALALLGTLSGRDCDKVARSGLTPHFLEQGVTFLEAERTLVCKKLYTQPMDLTRIPPEEAARFYRTEAPHTIFIGQVVSILGGRA